MIQIIYNFIRNYLIGETTIPGADDLANLLTFATIICFFFVLVRLVVWAFQFFSFRNKTRL